jgi:hypothetical protein
MNRSRKAQIFTFVTLALAFAIVVGRQQLPRSGGSTPPSPQDAIYAMLGASRAGDVDAYLATYTGQMRAALEQSVRETGAEPFRRYLKESNSAIKGVALALPQMLGDREASVRVEYVYQNWNEAQAMYLEKDAAGWKIARVEGSERVKTLIPYGTPVQ